jgi:ketosteroid isomerase-like protein
MTAYYTPDAYLMAEGIHPLQGQAAIREFWDAAITRALAARARRAIRFHESRSSVGYALCSVAIQIPPADGSPGRGNGTSRAAWAATIWQRDPDGTWRIAVDISTPLPTKTTREEVVSQAGGSIEGPDFRPSTSVAEERSSWHPAVLRRM